MEITFKKLDQARRFTYTLRHPDYPKEQTKRAVLSKRLLRVVSKEANAMKWGGYNRKGEEKMGKVFKKLFGMRGTFYLMTIAALALLLAENIKWSPKGGS